MTGHIVPFPGNDKPSRLNAETSPCCVLILPVIRIERHDDDGGRSRRDARRLSAQDERFLRAIVAWEQSTWLT